MQIKRKTLLQWGLIIAIIVSVRYYQHQDLLSDSVPIFSSQTLSGQRISSKTDEPILVHFWATWCVICEYENDNIQDLSKDYQVINIAMQSGNNEKIIEYATQNNMALDNMINDASGSLSRLFGVKGTPTSFFIKNNEVHFIEVGYTTEIGMRLRMWLLDVFY
jgi:thiol-disulfide isomerase/thioredoxin